ncbi:MAG: T9SS type A sorting domain-containing protein [Flavobacterium sp.]
MKLIIAITLLFTLNTFAQSQLQGCTDPLSNNYNPLAVVNDGSCTYGSASVSPLSTVVLPAAVVETSGLIKWGNKLITHNDSGDTKLYALDSITGAVMQNFPITGVTNADWEDIAQDSLYIYIGEFGNNSNGNRTNLRIIRVEKASLEAGTPITANINFSYSDQTDFTPKGGNNTDFDCEAMVVTQDSIYLFTKQWVSKKTSLYALPKTPGTYVAQLKTTHNVGGMITGATYIPEKRVVVLSGYSGTVQPFIYLLYDFNGHDFFSGNKRKISLSLAFHQTEGIASSNGIDYFITNEKFVQSPFINVAQKLHKVSLAPYLANYVENMPLGVSQNEMRSMIRVYPNPAGDILYIDIDPSLVGTGYSLLDMNAREAQAGVLREVSNKINVSKLSSGVYTIKVTVYPDYSYRLVKK